jgi:hypothetical protein
MPLEYARIGTKEFLVDPDLGDRSDRLVLREEPTGSQYDDRQALLGSMKIPGNILDGNTNMEDLFAHGEMVEVNIDKRALSEFQFKCLFDSMTRDGKVYRSITDAMAVYRKLNLKSKEWIDQQVDGIWKKHEEGVQEVARAEGESEGSHENSSEGVRSASAS